MDGGQPTQDFVVFPDTFEETVRASAESAGDLSSIFNGNELDEALAVRAEALQRTNTFYVNLVDPVQKSKTPLGLYAQHAVTLVEAGTDSVLSAHLDALRYWGMINSRDDKNYLGKVFEPVFKNDDLKKFQRLFTNRGHFLGWKVLQVPDSKKTTLNVAQHSPALIPAALALANYDATTTDKMFQPWKRYKHHAAIPSTVFLDDGGVVRPAPVRPNWTQLDRTFLDFPDILQLHLFMQKLELHRWPVLLTFEGWTAYLFGILARIVRAKEQAASLGFPEQYREQFPSAFVPGEFEHPHTNKLLYYVLPCLWAGLVATKLYQRDMESMQRWNDSATWKAKHPNKMSFIQPVFVAEFQALARTYDGEYFRAVFVAAHKMVRAFVDIAEQITNYAQTHVIENFPDMVDLFSRALGDVRFSSQCPVAAVLERAFGLVERRMSMPFDFSWAHLHEYRTRARTDLVQDISARTQQALVVLRALPREARGSDVLALIGAHLKGIAAKYDSLAFYAVRIPPSPYSFELSLIPEGFRVVATNSIVHQYMRESGVSSIDEIDALRRALAEKGRAPKDGATDPGFDPLWEITQPVAPSPPPSPVAPLPPPSPYLSSLPPSPYPSLFPSSSTPKHSLSAYDDDDDDDVFSMSPTSFRQILQGQPQLPPMEFGDDDFFSSLPSIEACIGCSHAPASVRCNSCHSKVYCSSACMIMDKALHSAACLEEIHNPRILHVKQRLMNMKGFLKLV